MALFACSPTPVGTTSGSTTTGEADPDVPVSPEDADTGGDTTTTGGDEDATTGGDPDEGDTAVAPDVEPPVDVPVEPDVPEPEEISEPDVPDVPDVPMLPPPSMSVTLNGSPAAADSQYTMPQLPPGPAVEPFVLDVVVTNDGEGPLIVSQIGLVPFNEDGSKKNVWVTFDKIDFASLPASVPAGESRTCQIRYAPGSVDPNWATFQAVTNSPETPVFRVEFPGPPIQPLIRVEPPAVALFGGTLAVPALVELEIHNDGLSPLALDEVLLDAPSEGFWIVDAPKPGALVKPLGKPGYAPAKIVVGYQPEYGDMPMTASLLIHTNDPLNSPANVPITTDFKTDASVSPCLFTYEGEADGPLSMGDAINGTVVRQIVGNNLGTTTCTLNSVSISNDPTSIWYSHEVVRLDEQGNPGFAQSLPVSFEPDELIAVRITYKAPGYAVNTTVGLGWSDPQPRSKMVNVDGAGPEPCLEFGPGTLDNPFTVQFRGEKAENVKRRVHLYNCGEGPVVFRNGAIHTEFGSPSPYWTLLTNIGAFEQVPAGGIRDIELAMYVTDSSLSVTGKLNMEHITVNGPEPLSIPLEGLINSLLPVPVADPGEPLDYGEPVAGEVLLLDGSGSANNLPAPSSVGYLWYLVSKPPGSQLILNGPPGAAQRAVVPDVAGTYGFGLIVLTSPPNPIASNTSVLTLTVAPAPDEEPEEPADGGGSGEENPDDPG